MPIDPAVLAALITAIIQLLLQLFGGDHAKVAAYVSGRDLHWYKPWKKFGRSLEIKGMIIARWKGPADQIEQAYRQVSAEFADASPVAVEIWAMPEP